MTDTIFNADCFDILPTIPTGSVDMLLVDLPYGATRNPWDSILPLDQLWLHYNRIVKEDGAMVFTSAAPFDKLLATSNLECFRYEWIWHKNKASGHLNAKKMPLRAHETILVFYRKAPTYNPQITIGHKPMNNVYGKQVIKGEPRNYNHAHQVANTTRRTTRLPRDVLNIRVHDNIKSDKIHPTQKPLALMEYFIRTYTNEGDTVLDNTMGVGTTCVAAKSLNRRFIGIEKDAHYYQHASDWLNSTISGSALSKTTNDLLNLSACAHFPNSIR